MTNVQLVYVQLNKQQGGKRNLSPLNFERKTMLVNLEHAKKILDEFYPNDGIDQLNKRFMLELVNRISSEGLYPNFKPFEDMLYLLDVIFKRLTLKPIEDGPDKWKELYVDNITLHIHKDCPLVHKEKSDFYQNQAYVFEFPDGRRTFSTKSRKRFKTFPYMPTFTVIKVKDFMDIDNFNGDDCDI